MTEGERGGDGRAGERRGEGKREGARRGERGRGERQDGIKNMFIWPMY